MRHKYLLSALCLFSTVADAATLTWISPATSNWSTGTNWDTGTPPVNGDSLIFPFTAAVGGSTNDLGTLNITSISLFKPYAISGNPLNLSSVAVPGSVLVNNQTTLDDVTILNNIALLNDLSVQVKGPAGQRLVLGPVDGQGHTITVLAGTGNLVTQSLDNGKVVLQTGNLSVMSDSSANISLGSSTTVDFNFAADGTYSGDLAGSGSMIMKNGSSTLLLTGDNTSSAPMQIDQGGIQGSTSNIKQNVTLASGAFVAFDQSVDGAYSGDLTGAGDVKKMGPSTLVVKGKTAYTGTTDLQTGALEFQSTGPQGNVTLASSTTLTLNPSTSGTLPGNITGPGTVSKMGTSSLVLPGTSSVSSTVVNNGQLAVSGSLTSSASTTVNGGGVLMTTSTGTVTSATKIQVNDGGAIKGAGTFSGGVEAKKGAKVVSRGSVVHMTVIGDINFNTGSILETELSPSAASLLSVTGNVNISPGSTLSVFFEPGLYTSGVTRTILTTTGALNNTFSSVTTNSAILSVTPVYLNSNELDLLITASPFASVVTSGNAGAVATCIDKIQQACSNSDMSTVIGQLTVEPNSNALESALNQLQPAPYKALTLTQENNTILVAKAVNDRLENFYQASCLANKDAVAIWGDVYVDQMKQGSKNGLVGFHSFTSGVIAGADRLIGQKAAVGGGVGYSHSSIGWNRSGAAHDGRVDSLFGSIYGNYFANHYFVNVALISGFSRYNAERRIRFLSINRTAKLHDNHGYDLMAHVSPGLFYKVKKVDLMAYGVLDYVFLHQNGFTESGADSLNLRVKSSRSNLWRGELAVQATRCITRENSKWIPLLKLGVIQEGRPNGGHYSAQFKETECCTFSVKGLNPNHTLFAPSAALTGLWLNDRLRTTLRYDGEFGSKYQDQRANFQMGYAF